ncbi:Uncharacterised protein [Mycobacterium tuberculosis]|nr:Uncharacterised protein [Mycobacterium tuberculosis]
MSASAAVADENEFAAWPNSAASVGPEPAPANINAELTSGGNTRKLITPSLPQLDVPGPSPPVTTNLRWLNTHSPILPARSSAAVPPA